MPQSPQEWYESTRLRIEADGYRTVAWPTWPTWPFDGELAPRELEPPGLERPRGGTDGVDCFICAAVVTDDSSGGVTRSRSSASPTTTSRSRSPRS